jgi:tripartite-type tricarboxylate transporter receptor subunit TctC
MNNQTVTTAGKYPDKPITIIVPYSAGGGMDLVARTLEKLAPKYLGQPLIVVNKPGGSGTIAWNDLTSANPDGYTIGITGVELLMQPLYGSTKYNYPTSLEPLAQIATSSMIVAVKADAPWKNIDDLIEYAKEHPGQLKFGHAGIGSFTHILGEMFGETVNINIEQVPFGGAGETTIALLGGHIQFAITNPMSIKEHVKSGTLRVLAVADGKRLADPVFHNVPTFKEQGVDVGCSYWYGIAAPKELPSEVKTKLVAGLKAIIADPEFQGIMKNIGLQVNYLGPEESAATWLADSQKLGKVVQETGILDRIKAQKN